MASIPYLKDGIIIALLVFQAILAAVVASDPATLGLSEMAVAWMAIANVGAGVLLNQLPRIGKPAEPPVRRQWDPEGSETPSPGAEQYPLEPPPNPEPAQENTGWGGPGMDSTESRRPTRPGVPGGHQ